MDVKKWIVSPLRLSHHPLCDNFSNHVFVIRGKKFCRGCTMFYPSLVLGGLVAFVLQFHLLPTITLGIVMTVLLLPTVVAQLFKLPRPMRDVSKAILGMDSGLGILVITFHPDLWARIAVILVAVPMIMIVETVRQKRDFNTCQRCPEFPNRLTYQCSGLKMVGNRMKIADLVLEQEEIPDLLAVNTDHKMRFNDI